MPMTCDRFHPRTGAAGGGAFGASTDGGPAVRGWDGWRRRACGGDSRGERAGRSAGGFRPRRPGDRCRGQAAGPVWRPGDTVPGGILQLGQALDQGGLRRGAAGSRGEFAAARRAGSRLQFSGRGAAGHADGPATTGDGGATGERVGVRRIGDDFLGTGRRAPVAPHRPGHC